MNSEKLLRWNIIIDALGSSIFVTGLAFYLTALVSLSPSLILSVIGTSTLAGVFLTVPIGFVSDYLRERDFLLILQLAQFLSAFLILIYPNKALVIVGLSSLFVLNRAVSSVRGSIPTSYLKKDNLIRFKSTVRVGTLVAVAIGALFASLMATISSPFTLMLIPILNCVSYILAILLTFRLSPVGKRVVNRPNLGMFRLDLGFRARIWLTLTFSTSLISSLAAAAFPFVIYHYGNRFAWILSVSTIIGVFIAILLRRAQSVSVDDSWVSRVLGISATSKYFIALSCGLTSVVALFFLHFFVVHSPFIAVALVVISAFMEVALAIGALALWDVQYSVGDDRRRGSIVALFTFASSLGMAFGQFSSASLLR